VFHRLDLASQSEAMIGWRATPYCRNISAFGRVDMNQPEIVLD
jgi:hypothetical protein